MPIHICPPSNAINQTLCGEGDLISAHEQRTTFEHVVAALHTQLDLCPLCIHSYFTHLEKYTSYNTTVGGLPMWYQNDQGAWCKHYLK